jgi:virginiamycin A acetyltransferase
LRRAIKYAFRALVFPLVLPMAALSGFGRLETPFIVFGQLLALVPGPPGTHLRILYYMLTLRSWGSDSYIGFGSYFAHATARVEAHVGIGAYCILGSVHLKERSKIASGVQVLSGAKQHTRDVRGRLGDSGRHFTTVSVGPHAWIGARAIVMADIGEGATVGAGAIVVKPVPSGVTVAGNPAKPVVSLAHSPGETS